MVVEFDDVLVCLGLVVLLVGLLSLATFEPAIFVFCSYAGAILLLAGVFAKLGLISGELRSKNVVVTVLFFASGMLFVTAVNMLFIDVRAHARLTHFAFTSADKLCLTFIRPYAYLFQPLLAAGVVALMVAIILTILGDSL